MPEIIEIEALSVSARTVSGRPTAGTAFFNDGKEWGWNATRPGEEFFITPSQHNVRPPKRLAALREALEHPELY